MEDSDRLVRASLGTLAVLGLELVMMDTPPTTAYLQVYSEERCRANCRFCAQASDSKADLTHIARGLYVPAPLNEVVRRLAIAYERGHMHRACIQSIMTPNLWEDAVYLISKIRRACSIPISFSVFPLRREQYLQLKKLGVDHLTIPLDACSEELFDRIKGKRAGSPYRWNRHMTALSEAVSIFGAGNVATHLILGLGERDEDAVKLIDHLHRKGILTALFACTPIEGTQLKAEPLDSAHYRRVQLAQYLIHKGMSTYEQMSFEEGNITDYGVTEKQLDRIIKQGDAFQTSGCPACNRPYATETHQNMQNYPAKPTPEQITEIKKQLKLP
jgi:biotin synthase